MGRTLAAYAVVTLLVTILPGPDSLLVLRYTAARGRRAALLCGAGVAAGLFVWGVMTAVGVAALIVRAHPLFVAVRIVGALYLLSLAVALWRRGGGDAKDRTAGVLGRPFPAGLVCDLANPKAAAFFLAVFPKFLPAGVPHAVGGVVLASRCQGRQDMITGAHVIIYSKRAEDVRALFRDTLGWNSVDAGDGWLIFGLPPAEVAVHPTDGASRHELYLLCDDIDKTVEELNAKGIEFSNAISDEGWGLLATARLPGGGELGIYQPRHPVAVQG